MKTKIYKFCAKHLAFILTIVITYFIGIILVCVQYIASVNRQAGPGYEYNFLESLLNSIVPTTITYVLGCILVNIVEILQNKADKYVFNIITCLSIFMYSMLFMIYLMSGFSMEWVFIELAATSGILFMNILCYKEKYEHRNHGLI